MDESKLLYAKSHEWALVEGEVCTVGITSFAVEQLTDVTYIELPQVGKKVGAGEAFGVIESVKSASDLYAPVAGEVVEVNERIRNDPALLAEDAYDRGWMIKLKTSGAPDVGGLMDKAGYDSQIAGGH